MILMGMNCGCIERDYFYEYKVTVWSIGKANESNITMILPIPMLNGKVHSIITNALDNYTERSSWHAIIIPEGWTARIVDTDYGKMLEVIIDNPKPPSGEQPEIIFRQKTDHKISNEPIGKEPILYPRFNETNDTEEFDQEYKTYFFLNNTAPNVGINIVIRFHGWARVPPESELRGFYEDYTDLSLGIPHAKNLGWIIVNGTIKGF
jgi:hypothetical protein